MGLIHPAATQSQDYGRTIQFTVTGTAVPKDRARARIVTPNHGKPFISHYTPAETRKYEERVKGLAQRAWGSHPPSARPIELQITIYQEIPDGWPKWKREAATRGEIAPTGKPDLDNVIKSIADAMNGVVFKDDGQVVSTDAVKLYAPEGAEGYVEVAVRENWRCASWITRILDFVLLR